MDITTLPTHPGTGLTAIGVVGGRPVWPVMGAAEPADAGDEGGDDPDGEGDDTDDDTEGDDDGDTWTPPTKEELEAERAANAAKLKRANDQAKRLREQLKANGGTTAPTKTAPPAKKTAPAKPEPAEEPAAPVADDGELERWQVRAIRADAKSALLAQGCDPDLVDAPLSRLNPADIDWDGDDPLLEDWVEEMKERYPKAFAKPTPAPAPKPGLRKAPSIDQGAGSGGANGQPARQRPSLGETLIAAGGGLTSDGRLRRR